MTLYTNLVMDLTISGATRSRCFGSRLYFKCFFLGWTAAEMERKDTSLSIIIHLAPTPPDAPPTLNISISRLRGTRCLFPRSVLNLPPMTQNLDLVNLPVKRWQASSSNDKLRTCNVSWSKVAVCEHRNRRPGR